MNQMDLLKIRKINKRCQAFLITFFLFLPMGIQASPIKGIYGIPSIIRNDPSTYLAFLKKARVNAVFVPADKEIIRFFKERGFNVFISINGFGGKSPWKKCPGWHRRKLSVKPGITCLWQVSGRNEISDFDEWMRLDMKYIDEWSLWLDFKILLKTPWVVLKGTGR